MSHQSDCRLANLKPSRLPLADAIDQIAEAIIITSVDGIIQYVNAPFERITGYSRSEVIGQNLRLLKSGQHSGRFYREMWATICSGAVWSGRIINERKDGTLFEEEVTISPLRDESNAIIHYVAVKRDVTYEVQLEKQLRQAQKMEAIGTLAGGIAHDFNNILSAIIGYIELAQMDISENSTVMQKLDKVLTAGHRAKNLVMQILAFSRQNELERKPVQISLVIREVFKLLQVTLPETIQIHQRIGSEAYYIPADSSQIHQLLLNLCTNAAHAMEASGGALEVRTRAFLLDLENSHEFPELIPGCYLELTVTDTGHGMNRSTLERLFDPFFTTKPSSKGTGMGLSVVHGIVKRHQGAIRVQSEEGRGSAFQILLPRSAYHSRPAAKKQELLSGGHERILFIDDEEPLADLGRQQLERLGYRVETATDPLKALLAFRRQPRDFDLIICDVTMPKMTGITLARKLMEIRANIPIVLTTGFSELTVEKKALQMGIKALLMKPLTMKDLADTIRKAIG